VIDLSGCINLYANAFYLVLKQNPDLAKIQMSGCFNAVDDKAMILISDKNKLSFLDISYCKRITD
jgi:hypothetical protein